jgi:signal transduction histidine kinase
MPKEVEIVADFPSDGPLVNANADQIHQVLKNLLTNAWESQNRGTIHLSMQTITPVDIPAAHRFPLDSQFEHHLYASLSVRDTGCGIAAPDIEQIFDPFYTSSFLGRGLGLPIALGIVRAHGGFISVTSKVGKGSVFRIFLPVYEEEITLSTRRTIVG